MNKLTFFDAAKAELARARAMHAPYTSSHHGYAVLLEEVDELWEEVRKRRQNRDPLAMLRELIQIAAVAARFAEDVVEPMCPGQSPTKTTQPIPHLCQDRPH